MKTLGSFLKLLKTSAKKFYSRGKMPHVLKMLLDSAIKTIGIGRDIKNIKKQAQVSRDNVQPRTNQKGCFEILCDKWCKDTWLTEHCYHFKNFGNYKCKRVR